MAHRKKRQPGPQSHAEGQHGDKTHRRFIEQLQQRTEGSGAEGHPVEGHHSAHPRRQQHDQAEKGR